MTRRPRRVAAARPAQHSHVPPAPWPERVVVPWGTGEVEAEVLGVYRVPPNVQVRLALVTDPGSAYEQEERIEFDLHVSEVPPAAMLAVALAVYDEALPGDTSHDARPGRPATSHEGIRA
ncbi:MAG: hypothetical protein ACXV4A_10990 [Actinomycetes bacterium]